MAYQSEPMRDSRAGRLTRRTLLRTTGGAIAGGVAGSLLERNAGLAAGASGMVRSARFQATPPAVTPTGSVTLAQATDIHEMDPHRELWSDDSSLHFAIFDSLVQRDDKMNLIPVLA